MYWSVHYKGEACVTILHAKFKKKLRSRVNEFVYFILRFKCGPGNIYKP